MSASEDKSVHHSRILVKTSSGMSDEEAQIFEDNFVIGREDDCDVILKHDMVSRKHAEVVLQDGEWWLRDLNSTNGTIMHRHRIGSARLEGSQRVTVGKNGPSIIIEMEGRRKKNPGKAKGPDHYFGNPYDRAAGDHTRMIRRAIYDAQENQRRRYSRIIIGLFVVAAIAIYIIFSQMMTADNNREVAQELFYSMKESELKLKGLEEAVRSSKDPELLALINKNRDSQAVLKKQYGDLLTEMDIYDSKLSEEDRLIFRIARMFGECELSMPAGFVDEVKRYIRYWQKTDRYAQAVQRARAANLHKTIPKIMLANDLPPQFFYLALQESDFKEQIVGPPTRSGIAKGIWQFIPVTAARYGLKTGPLVEERRYDPRDDRFKINQATEAAARYLSDIYRTKAQASGFLVMASYNWGEHNVEELIEKLPLNPRERNFWKLLENHRAKFPTETYDYVYYIISAAVIGENPRLFGFDFDNPLN